jgi:transposase
MVNKLIYLGYTLSYQGEKDITNKDAKYTKTMGVINNVLKPSLVTKTHLHKTLAQPIVCYRS